MRCPKCGEDNDKVVDSRSSKNGAAIRRRRQCLPCDYRFTTYETIEQDLPTVIKRNGGTEPFSRKKLLAGMVRACEKRPVAMATLEEAADALNDEVIRSGAREIPSRNIGAMVLEKLGEIDKVARVRYASVYRDFQELEDFIEEVDNIQDDGLSTGLQPELFEPGKR